MLSTGKSLPRTVESLLRTGESLLRTIESLLRTGESLLRTKYLYDWVLFPLQLVLSHGLSVYDISSRLNRYHCFPQCCILPHTEVCV